MSASRKIRADQSLVKRGLADSRTAAQALIMAGKVKAGKTLVAKPSAMLDEGEEIVITGQRKYVSRGGDKLEAALDFFRIAPAGKTVLDIGSSTGGFTDCLLQRGAAKVYAVDVGYGLIHEKLRSDGRVVLIERTNARNLNRGIVPEQVDMAVIDCSFISLELLLKPACDLIVRGGIILPLVKPQFEVGKNEVEKGGVIRSPEKRRRALKKIMDFAISLGLDLLGEMESPVRGRDGNIEYFLYLKKT